MSQPPPVARPRASLLAENVVVAAQPLAAQAGLSMLAQGGNAVDAAIACAATLMVVEPVGSGLGADAFALIHVDGRVHALNGSGRSPQAPIPGWHDGAVPGLGWPSVTVPGAVSAWQAMSARFGRLPFAVLLAPAIRYASDGFQVTPLVSRVWRGLKAMYLKYPELLAGYFAEGAGPQPGERFRSPAIAHTLARIAETGGEAFYRGDLAERMAMHALRSGGHLRADDLAMQHAEWVEPLASNYRGATIHEMPPNSQGLAASIALAILDRLDLPSSPDSPEIIHLQIEAMKLAFAETYAHVSDPEHLRVPPQALLDPAHITRLLDRIDAGLARFPEALPTPAGGGTSYLCCGDANGMVVSYIQSSGPGFGSGIFVPDLGIPLQNRAVGFAPQAEHCNAYAPGKRPFHTNSPALVSRDGRCYAAFGLMGWSMQPQAHVQFACRALDFGQSPSIIMDAPRWRIAAEEQAILLEPGLESAAAALQARGHRIVATEKMLAASTPFGSHLMFGGAAYLQVMPEGYAAAADPRRDGAAVGF